jgi:hypothetical protein
MREMTNANVRLVVILLSLLGLLLSGSAWPESQNPLAGACKLVGCEMELADGKSVTICGAAPAGILVYDPSGYMLVHYSRVDVARFASADRTKATPEETKALFDVYLGYWGRYEINSAENSVKHIIEVSSFPNWMGVTLNLKYDVASDPLTLKRPGAQFQGQSATGVFRWERLR